jgi:hypothetical protein
MRGSDAARVGLTVLLAGALFAVIWFVTHGGSLSTAGPERLRVAFDNAQGITENAPVTLAGVPAGVVEKVRIEEVNGKQKAVLTLRIDQPKKTPLPPRVKFSIVGSVLGFGTPHVEITPYELPKPGAAGYPPGAQSAGQEIPPPSQRTARGPILTGESTTTLDAVVPKATALLDNLNDLTRRMSALTDSFQRLAANPQLQKNLLATSENFAAASRNIETFSRSAPAIASNLQAGSQQLVDLMASLQYAGLRFQGLLTRMDQLMVSLNGTAGQFTGAATEMHGAAADLHAITNENRAKIGAVMSAMQESMKLLSATLASAQSLIGDPAIRADFRQTADNVQAATANLTLITRDVHNLTGDPAVQGDLKATVSSLRQTTEQTLVLVQRLNGILGAPAHGDTIQRIERRAENTQVNAEAFYSFGPGHAQVNLDATVPWTPSTFWRAGLFDAGERNRFNLQFGQRLEYGNWQPRDLWLRAGVHASHLGLGLDWGPPGRSHVSADIYDLRRTQLDLHGNLRLAPYVDGILGFDNIFHNASPVVGLRVHYER